MTEYKKGLCTGIAFGLVFMAYVWAVSAAWFSPQNSSPVPPAAELQKLRGLLEAARAAPAEELLKQDTRSAFNRYTRVRFLKEEALEDPVKWLPALGATKEELESLCREAGDVLAQRLTWHLKQKRFLPQAFQCKVELGGGASYDYLEMQNSYSVAKEIEQIVDDTWISYDFDLCGRAVLQYAAKEGPEYRRYWLAQERGGWGDAAGSLVLFLTEDRIPPSVLGLSAQETYKLLEMAGDHGS